MLSNRRQRLLAAGVLCALGLALLLRGRGGAASIAAPAGPPSPVVTSGHRLVPPPAPIAAGDFSVTAQRERLEEYRRAAAHPWWSRPHDDGSRYLLEWNKPVVSDLPLSDERGGETTYHFAADKMHVVYGEALTSWIEVWKTGHSSQRMPAVVRQAWVMATDGAPGRLLPLTFQDDGELRYTNRFVPSEHKELASVRQVRIVAEVEAAGQTRLMIRDFTYAPREVLRVVGISDSIANGSLAVTLDVEVLEAGVYTFQANLLGGDGQAPIGWSDIGAHLAVGRTKVDVIFFGKVLHDRRLDGPYLVRDLRGFLHGTDGLHIWWSHPGTHRTGPYRATDFSAAEWDSAEKREKLRAMEDIIDKTSRGEMGGAGPSVHIHVGADGVARQISP